MQIAGENRNFSITQFLVSSHHIGIINWKCESSETKTEGGQNQNLYSSRGHFSLAKKTRSKIQLLPASIFLVSILHSSDFCSASYSLQWNSKARVHQSKNIL